MNFKDTFFSKKETINCRGTLVNFSEPQVMAILNVTNDSFYKSSRFSDEASIEKRVNEIATEGATIIDVGGYSSRPGATDISVEEEWERVEKALKIVKKQQPDLLVSVDTFRADIAKRAIEGYGIDFVNDISAGDADKNMFELVSKHKVAYILMHMQGTPQTMQQNPNYKNAVISILKYFAEKLNVLRQMGVNDLVIDPGFGFGKTLEHNYEILKSLSDFKVFQIPLLVGVSRKSMIYKYLGVHPDEALAGTISLQTIALQQGANILRVHDVKEAVQTVQLINKLNEIDRI